MNSDRSCEGLADRWQLIWSHREQLLRVARRRSVSIEDAEDAVHEAMVRAAEHPNVDRERIGAWLTSVTIRLCVDRHRQLSRDARVALRNRSMLAAPGTVLPEDTVCDLAEANWLALRSAELPGRQAEALRLRAENLEVAQVAQRMGLTYKAVESLRTRARRTLSAVLAGTLAVAMALWRGRPRVEGGASAAALASTAATLVVTGLVLVAPSEAEEPASPLPPMSGPVARPTPYDDSWGLPLPNRHTTPSDGADTSDKAYMGLVFSGPSRQPTMPRRVDSSPTQVSAPTPDSTLLVDPVPGLLEPPAVPAAPDLPTLSLPTEAHLPADLTTIPVMCSRSLNCGAGKAP
ncbi:MULTISPECIES: sigma-70 family RNA polymerase sigma factor [unclassified Streptomyces]|uniref:RNA polymerase sigma factor n=1 Tax=unclassified Streptomyces TaxID=2593676 RepID=UPI0027E26AC7|nr:MULTISPECIES: sigma-70 family RNA polymerase sigma factor [unclassified Streptomyces]